MSIANPGFKELELWWGRPFILQSNAFNEKYNVYCFDGGAWDRATWCGDADKLEEAVQIARGLLGAS